MLNTKKLKAGLIISLISLGCSQVMAAPAETQFDVNARIENSCVLTNPLNLSFEYKNDEGHISSQSMGIKCTTGSTYKIVLNYGLNGNSSIRKLSNDKNSDLLSYQIYVKDSSNIVGNGDNGTVVFEGVYARQESLLLEMDVKVPRGQYVSQGTYKDTIMADIQY